MTEEFPLPLVSPEVDLRDFKFMPLDVVRLRDSRVGLLENAEAFRAAVFSWCAAWHQTPCGSIPDDDAELCRLLGYGRDMKLWRKLREEGALHGWIKCSDGRLYHPVIAEKAIESWEKKKTQRQRTRAATEARKSHRDDTRDDTRDVNRNGEYAVSSRNRHVEHSAQRNVHQGTGNGREDSKKEKKEIAAAFLTAEENKQTEFDLFQKSCHDALPAEATWPVKTKLDFSPIIECLNAGATPADVLAAIKTASERAIKSGKSIGSWTYFTDVIRDRQRSREAAKAANGLPKPVDPKAPWSIERQRETAKAWAKSCGNMPWFPEWGPTPGKPGCKIDDAVLRAEGVPR